MAKQPEPLSPPLTLDDETGREAPSIPPSKKQDPPLDNRGHRQRLRERFLTAGPESLADYEILEMLLFGAIPQRDTKPLAKMLLAKFKSLSGVLHAPAERLRAHFPASPAVVATLILAGEISLRLARAKIVERPVFGSWPDVIAYCQQAMQDLIQEETRLLFLNRHNQLLADEVLQKGTIDRTAIFPREIVRRAFELGAGAIILVHNHPAGDPNPSLEDREITTQILKVLRAVGIEFHDHVIIGNGKYFSFKNAGLL